jgi:hypothetical protein
MAAYFSLPAYFIMLAVLGGLSLVMAINDMALIVTLLTLGLGLPFVAAATFFLYWACFLPLALMWNGQRSMGFGFSIVLVLLAVFAPAELGQNAAETITQELRKDDRAPAATLDVWSVEFRLPQGSLSGVFEKNGRGCGSECRTLLANPRIDFVRIVEETGPNRFNSSVHRLMRGADCAVPGSTASASNCVLVVPDTFGPAELTFTLTETWGRQRPGTPDNAFVQTHLVRLASGVMHHGTQGTEIFRQTEIDISAAMRPTALVPIFKATSSHGVEFVRRRERSNPIVMAEIIEKLGLARDVVAADVPKPSPAAHDWRKPVDDTSTREVIAILDLPQHEAFDAGKSSTISDWVMQARMIKDWTPEQIVLLRRIMHDRRIDRGVSVGQIFERDPGVARALLPDFIEIAEQGSLNASPLHGSTYVLRQLDPSLVQPYGSRIVALIDRDADMRRRFIASVGRLGFDPTSMLFPLPPMSNQHLRMESLRGACLAESRWAPSLVAALRRELSPTPSKQSRATDQPVLYVLIALGDRQTVEAYADRIPEPPPASNARRTLPYDERQLVEFRRNIERALRERTPSRLCSSL